jgi:hypothetical protein
LSSEGAVPSIVIESSNLLMPSDEQYPFCVCNDESAICSIGNHPKGCDPSSTRVGTIAIIDLMQRTLSNAFETKFTDNHYTYSAVIDNLVQDSDNLGGFGVRGYLKL